MRKRPFPVKAPVFFMSHPRIDVLTLGNAIVDVLAHTDEAFLLAKKVHKGAMQLIDEARAEELFQAMGPATVVGGGSGANTAVGAASLGVRAGFIGKVKAEAFAKLSIRTVGDLLWHFPSRYENRGLITPLCDGSLTMAQSYVLTVATPPKKCGR